MVAKPNLSRTDLLSAIVLWLAAFTIFGAGVNHLGFYTDDADFLSGLASVRLPDLSRYMRAYVPGRNLHILWQYLIYRLVGEPAAHLAALHVVQSALDGMVVAGFFVALRSLCLPGHVSVIAAGLFAFWPICGEVHYWLTAAPQNLLSTLFVVLFVMTTLALAAGSRRSGVWALDAAAFVCALFTYDQVFFVLLLLMGFRLAAVFFRSGEHRWRFAVFHAPYFGVACLYVWVKLNMQASEGPVLRSGSLQMLNWNIRHTISNNLGKVWWVQVAPFYSRVAATDWVLSVAAALALVALAIWLLRRERPLPERSEYRLGRPYVLLFALSFYVAAYLPVWLWYIAPRHHYLPSIGLFAGGAVCLAWVLEWSHSRTVEVLAILLLGAAICLCASASRGESRYWEDSFSAKKRLFAELKPDLAGKHVLALEDFPSFLGPAPLIVQQDVRAGPGLLYHDSPLLGPRLNGSIGSVPAPGGLFLYSNSVYGPGEFRFYPAQHALVVRFTSWENGRLKFQEDPFRPLPYEVILVGRSPGQASFTIHNALARRESDGVAVSLQFSASSHNYLAAIISFSRGNEFHRWGQLDREGRLNVIPILLISREHDPTSAGYKWIQNLRIASSPRSDRVQLEFFEVSEHSHPLRLGRIETVVGP